MNVCSFTQNFFHNTTILQIIYSQSRAKNININDFLIPSLGPNFQKLSLKTEIECELAEFSVYESWLLSEFVCIEVTLTFFLIKLNNTKIWETIV